jgi:hypothetical protein
VIYDAPPPLCHASVSSAHAQYQFPRKQMEWNSQQSAVGAGPSQSTDVYRALSTITPPLNVVYCFDRVAEHMFEATVVEESQSD